MGDGEAVKPGGAGLAFLGYCKLIARRAVHLVIVLFLLSFGTFMLLQLTPGNPAVAVLGQNATPREVAVLDRKMGLDLPVLTQYGHWISHALVGNLGNSLVPPYGTVVGRIAQTLPVSAELVILALLLALIVAVPAAIWSAYRAEGLVDRVTSAASFGILSIPTFVSGLVLALLFAVEVHAFPRAEWVSLLADPIGNLDHAFLPALALGLAIAPIYARILRAELIGTLQQEFILFAEAKGLPIRKILWRYALRPSSLSLITLSGVTFGALLGGTVVVETIYALPGMGSMLVSAVGQNDFPLVQGIVLVIGVAYVLINVLVDISYGLLDPRTRRGSS